LPIGLQAEKASSTVEWHARCEYSLVRNDDTSSLKEPPMNSEKTTNQILSAILRNVDVTEVTDGLLARLNLRRRRPAMSMMSAVGLIGLGAVGAIAVVALVPAVREALTDDPVGRLREAVDNAIGATEEAAMDAEQSVKRKLQDAKESAKGAIRGQSRHNNGNKLDV